MGSRPPRASKSSESASKPAPTSRTENSGEELDAGATIKDASLERREIPSYSDTREARIAERAYWRAERRGFAPGAELDDWLEAEREVDDQGKSTSSRSSNEAPRSERNS
jgi:hypothetical protein